jgi:hypothetical protein
MLFNLFLKNPFLFCLKMVYFAEKLAFMFRMKKTLLISMVAASLACNNPVEKELEQPLDTEISCKYVIKVGKNKEYQTIAEAAAGVATKDSVLIEIDAGTYSGDVARWQQNELYIRAVGGEVVLDANGKNYGGKGIWEIDGGRVKVEGITFKNAKVPDQNGAGIKLTKGDLIIDKCKFLNNEMGILTGNSGGTLLIKNSEFGYGGFGDGYSHNLYVGYIDTLVVTGCYFHHANQGHLLKSRAKMSIVKYCRITDENDGLSQSSYELDFPSGGINIVVGNIIQQSINSPNSSIVDFAGEKNDYWPDNVLYMSHNTIVNNKASNNCLLIAPSNKIPASGIFLVNNLIDNSIIMPASQLLGADAGNERFNKDELTNNYTPKQVIYNRLTNKIATDVNKYLPANLTAQNISLIPTEEYSHPCNTIKLTSATKIAGAIQRSESR